MFNFERDLNKIELSKIDLLLQELNQNNENYISKNKSVLDDPDLVELKQFIDKSIEQYLIEVYEEQTQLKIGNSWLNKTLKNQSHLVHCHANSYISGVFYIDTQDDDKIIFYNNDVRNNYYKPIIDNYNEINSQSWWLPAKKNSLILFHSDLNHSVPKTSNEKRISLSFNTIIVSDYRIRITECG